VIWFFEAGAFTCIATALHGRFSRAGRLRHAFLHKSLWMQAFKGWQPFVVFTSDLGRPFKRCRFTGQVENFSLR